MSKKSSFSGTDGDVCCSPMVGVSICPFHTGVENGLFKGVNELFKAVFPLIKYHGQSLLGLSVIVPPTKSA